MSHVPASSCWSPALAQLTFPPSSPRLGLPVSSPLAQPLPRSYSLGIKCGTLGAGACSSLPLSPVALGNQPCTEGVVLTVGIMGSGSNLLWYQSGRERGVTLIPLSPPRKAGYIFQWPEEQCGAVAATWEKRRLLKQNPLAVIFQGSSRNEELTLTFTSLLAPVHALSSIPRPGAAFACSSAAPARHCV